MNIHGVLFRACKTAFLSLCLAIGTGIQSRAATTLFSDGFELGLNGWQRGDNNPSSGLVYWDVVDSAFGGEGTHSGTNKVYCAAVGYTGTSATPGYTNDMTAYLLRTLDLTAVTNATLSFWYKIPGIETSYDFAKVFLDNTELWSRDTSQTTWTLVTLSLDAFVGGIHTLKFQFSSDYSVTFEGWYLDDILVTDAVTPGPPPPNDNFSAAQLLSGGHGTATAGNRQATFESGEPASGFTATNSVWFRWTPYTNGPVTFTTEGSAFDTVLCVYTGSSVGLLTLVASDDNTGSNNTGQVTFPAVAGTPYSLSVRGSGNAAGSIQLDWNQPNAIGTDLLPDLILWADPALNYLYGWYLDRTQIPGRTLLRVSTATPNIGAGPLELIGSSSTPGVYQRIYQTDGTYRERYAGTFTFHPGHGHLHFDNWLNFHLRSVLPGDGVGAIVVSGDKTSFAIIDLVDYDPSLPGHPASSHYSGGLTQGLSVGWSDVYGAGLQGQWIDVTDVVPGRYWLEAIVDPANSVLEINETNNSARILIDLSPSDLTGAPPNDYFTNATVLPGVTAGLFGWNVGATKERASSEPNHAGNAGGASVWYAWTAPSNMSVTISTDGSDFDTILAVYTGSAVGALSPVVSDDDSGVGAASLVTFSAIGGTTYRIAVDGYGGATGNIQFNLNPAWNNSFSSPVVLTGLTGTVTASSRGATLQVGEPLHAGVQGGASIWFSWTAPTNGPVTFETAGSGFDTVLAVYTGSTLGALTPIASDDNSGPTNTSRLSFGAVSNQTYRIAVDGVAGANGLVRFSWFGPTAPFITAQPVGLNLVEGATLQLQVGAGGSFPLSYQWRHADADLTDEGRISGASSAALTVGKVLHADAGAYTVVISNLFGSVTSAPANLIVVDNPRVIYVAEQNVAVGGTAMIPIRMQAVGNEHALNFSVLFDPTVLSHPQVSSGADITGALFSANTNQAASGQLGISIAFPPGMAVAAGSTQELARVLFDVRASPTNGATTFVGFGDVPLARYLASTNGATLGALFAAGVITLQQVNTVASGLVLPDGRFQFSLTGLPERHYIVEIQSDLASSLWQPLSTNITTATGLFQFIDPQPASLGQRFYRARLAP